MEQKKKRSLYGFVTDMRGDKVVLIIIFCLFLTSAVALFSSTSSLVNEETTRVSMFGKHLAVMVFSGFLIWVCYQVRNVSWFIRWSKYLILLTMFLLVYLFLEIRIPKVMEAEKINGAWRTIRVFGHIQVHVFEVAKVFMVMYLSWAVHAWKERDEDGNNGFHLTKKLAEKYNKPFFAKPFVEELVYIFLPIFATTAMILFKGSNSSGIFIFIVMTATILIGGYSVKNTLKVLGMAAVLAAAVLGLNEASNGALVKSLRWETLISRLNDFGGASFEEKLHAVDGKGNRLLKPGTAEYDDFIDDNRQVQSAKIAIYEGRKMKGPGGSTQKYAVPLIFGDFMYSFLIEEYGLAGGLFILILFGSLLARGSLIANNCESTYGKTVVGGLTVLICGQALMHILVNVGMMPMTGQTLPLISDGKSAFIMFSIAFGVLLSMSKLAKENIERIEKEYEPDIEESGDELQDRMNDLDEMDNF